MTRTTSTIRGRDALHAALLAVALCGAAPAARANVGPPWSGGQLAAEPVGVLDVSIFRETLTLDLRPLAAGGPARVEAVYRLLNDGPEKKLDLRFISGSAGSDFEVLLNDTAVPGMPDPDAKVPASWKRPETTPALDGAGTLPFHTAVAAPLAFTVVVPTGPNTLTVRYAAQATVYHRDAPTVYRQLAYVLAPARAWARFGGLDVTVHLPPGWRAACAPELGREGDTLRGSFTAIPADALALTVQAPEGWAYRPAVYATQGLIVVAVLGGALACFLVGARLGRYAWAWSILLGVAWGALVFAAGMLAVFGPEALLPAGQVNHYGYGQAFAFVGVVLLSAAVVVPGFVIAWVTTALVKRSARWSAPWRAAHP